MRGVQGCVRSTARCGTSACSFLIIDPRRYLRGHAPRYDEGTAFMPVVSYSSQLPVHPSFRFIALDVDGHDLPSDWYMRIAGFAAEAFHGERTLLDSFPYKELQDYWSTRPRRVGVGDAEERKRQVDVDEVTRAFREWEVSEGSVGIANDAPPPYSLEDRAAQQGLRQRQQQTPAEASGGGRTSRPPVRQHTRPSSSHHSSLSAAAYTAAVPLAAATVAHTLSAGSASAAPRHTPSALRPSVNMLSHPSLSTMSYHPPPIPQRPAPPPRSPSGTASLTQGSYDLGWQHTHGHGHSPEPSVAVHHGANHPQHSGHVSPHGYAAFPIPSPDPGMAFPSALGHRPVPVEYGRGRSKSRFRSKSRSRSRSRSRSSSGSHKKKKKKRRSPVRHPSQGHLVHHASAHIHHAHSHNQVVHTHGHGHSLSPVGSSHTHPFPGAGEGPGSYYVRSESGMSHGMHAPLHSNPVGYDGRHGVGSGHAHGHQQHQAGYNAAGYGYGYGQGGYDEMGSSSHSHSYQQQQGYGYTSRTFFFSFIFVGL